jgi:predicted enzyme related to lactoylglutathione lyase
MTNTTAQPATTTDSPATVPAQVTWFEVHSADPARAKRFYGEVFGWTFDESMPDYTMVQLGDAPIGGGIVDTQGAYPSHALFMVQVVDVAASLQAAADHGGSIVVDAQTSPAGITFGYAANPDGSVFGVYSPPAA